MTIPAALPELVRAALKAHTRLQDRALSISEQDDLYAAGMTSHCSVNLMLALESRFDLEFPDHMLTRSTFSSIGSIATVLSSLGAMAA
jgi:acyl carrier protein